MNLKVSIITPSYNSEKFISETIKSIQKQTYEDWELLITDDCSSDKTVEIIEKYQETDNRIRLFKLIENGGAAVARNNSIKKAKGRFIAFCDSDDVWFPEKLEKQIVFMEKNNLAFTYSAYQKMNEDGTKRGVFYPPGIITFSGLLKTCSIGCLTVIYDTRKIGKIYLPLIKKSEDYALWLLIFKKIKKTKGLVNEPLAYYRVRNNSISSNKLKVIKYQLKILKEFGEVNSLQRLYYFLHYSVNGFMKYLK